MTTEERLGVLSEGTPPRNEVPEALARWWEARWKRYAEKRFGVIMPLWLRTRDEDVDKTMMRAQYGARYYECSQQNPVQDSTADGGLGLHANVVAEMLGFDISKDACAMLMAEMDVQRAGGVDGHIDFLELSRWWSQYSDDESLLQKAWVEVQPDNLGNMDAEKVSRLIQKLLRPSVKEARLAVWAARAESCAPQPDTGEDVVNLVADWLTTRGEATPRDKARISTFLSEKAAMSSIFAEDADGPSDKDKELVEEKYEKDETLEDQDLELPQPVKSAADLEHYSAFDPFFDQWMRMHRTATDTGFESTNGEAVHPQRRLQQAWDMCGPEYDAVVKALLNPTDQGLDNMLDEIDLNNDKVVNKTEVLTWWKKNCSPDVRAFERAWLEADQDCNDELSRDELKALLGFGLRPSTDGSSTTVDGERERESSEYVRTRHGRLIGLDVGDSSMLVKSLDDIHEREDVDAVLNEAPPSHAGDGSEHRFAYTLRVNITQGTRLKGLDRGGTSDPYVVCKMEYSKEAEQKLVQADEEAARKDAEADRQAQAARRKLQESSPPEANKVIPGPQPEVDAADPEPEPQAAHSAEFYCQFSGEGEFVKVRLSLLNTDDDAKAGVRRLEVRRDDGSLVRRADISNCKVMKPRIPRQVEPGRQHFTRKLFLAKPDSEGDVKYIIATDDCATLNEWISFLGESSQPETLTVAEKQTLKKRYAELTGIRKLAKLAYDEGSYLEAAEAFSQAIDLLSSVGTCHLQDPDQDVKSEPEAHTHRRSAKSGLTNYVLEFTTADEMHAGTDAQVYVSLFGKNAAGEEIESGKLELPWTEQQFERGQVDYSLLNDVPDVGEGELTRLTVGHDGSRFGSAWCLHRVVVRSTTSGSKAWTFPCNTWLDRTRKSVDLVPVSMGRQASLPIRTGAQPIHQVSRFELLCGRARCWRKLAVGADMSTDEQMQLWTDVRDDSAAATEGMKQEDTREADVLYSEAVTRIDQMTTDITKAALPHDAREGTVHCQFGGKGNFKKVKLQLGPSLSCRHTAQSTERETTYQLSFWTGKMARAGTDAKVYITLFGRNDAGEEIDTGERLVPSTKQQFEAGKVDEIFLEGVKNVGELTMLTVRHDGKGLGSGWYLESIDVQPASADKDDAWKVHFPCHRWLDEYEGDGRLEQELFPESPGLLSFQDGGGAEWTAELHADAQVFDQPMQQGEFQFALRLDLGKRPDSMGHRTYIIAAPGETELGNWKKALGSYCSLQAKKKAMSGHKVLQKTIENMKPQKTDVKHKTNDAYWDEMFTFEWLCTRRELNFLQLKVECLDWNLVGEDKLIGKAPAIEMSYVLEKLGTPQCYSHPFTANLSFKSSGDEAETQRGDIYMHVVLEEHLSKPARTRLYPDYMNEKYLASRVNPPDAPRWYALDVCLLGLRGLQQELRYPSVEIIVNGDDKPSVIDTTLAFGSRVRESSNIREAHQSKRLYVVGQGLNPSLADFDDVYRELQSLSQTEIKRRAVLAGLQPALGDGRWDVGRMTRTGGDDLGSTSSRLTRTSTSAARKWTPTAESVYEAYKTVRFSHPTDSNWHPKSLTIKIWHKPSRRTGRFARHQPSELYATACIPLIRRESPTSTGLQDNETLEAIKLYKKGMQLLHVESDRHDTHTVLHPSESQMKEIQSELATGEGGDGTDTSSNFADREETSGTVTDKLKHSKDHEHSKAADLDESSEQAIEMFKQGMQHAALIDDKKAKGQLLTKLNTGYRKAKLQRKFGGAMEAWERGREVLEGTWESSGSTVSRAPVFGSWYLYGDASRSPLGAVKCAFKLGDATEVDDLTHRANTEWKRVQQAAIPRLAVVRVYVLRGRNLRAMDRNNKSDPYVICTLTASGASKGTTERQILGSSNHRINATLNPEFRQVFEFNEILMPGGAQLRLSVKDWDAFSLDDDIGFTDIDLEHRYFCSQWHALEHKPLETRELTRKTRRVTSFGNGSLQLWVDIIPTSPGVPLPPRVDISLPTPEKLQLRVIVWNAENMNDDSGSLDDGDGLHMNDLYFSGHLRTKVGDKIVDQSIS